MTRLAILLAAVLLYGCEPALAQMACAKRADLIKSLETEYAEKRQGLGLTDNGRVYELFVSENGEWTILMTRIDGLSCLLATGRNWEAVKPKTPQT